MNIKIDLKCFFVNIVNIYKINKFSCKKSVKLFIKSPFKFRNNSIFLRFIYKYLFIIFQEIEKPKNLIKIEGFWVVLGWL